VLDGDILKRNESIPDASVDEIVALGTFLSSPKRGTFEEVIRILKPGGLLIIGQNRDDEYLGEVESIIDLRLKSQGFEEIESERAEYDYGPNRTPGDIATMHAFLEKYNGFYRVKTYKYNGRT